MRERNRLQTEIGNYDKLVQEFDENVELIGLAEAEDDKEILSEAEDALRALAEKAR